MKNTLTDLNNYLFETLERLTDDSLTAEEMEAELRRADAVTSVAETVIHNGELSLKAMKHAEEYNIGSVQERRRLPAMLDSGDA